MIVSKTIYNMSEDSLKAAKRAGITVTTKSTDPEIKITTLEGLQWEVEEFITTHKLKEH